MRWGQEHKFTLALALSVTVISYFPDGKAGMNTTGTCEFFSVGDCLRQASAALK